MERKTFSINPLCIDLVRQSNEEILNLKKYLNDMSNAEIIGDRTADAVRQILTTAIGLEKIASVLGYFDALEDGIKRPQLVSTEECLRVWGEQQTEN